jgi:hypothetical protein
MPARRQPADFGDRPAVIAHPQTGFAQGQSHARAAAFGQQLTILGLSAEAEAGGGRSGTDCDCADPAVRAPTSGGASATGTLTLLGFTTAQSYAAPGPLLQWERHQTVLRARRSFFVGPVPFTAGIVVTLDLRFSLHVDPRFSIPDAIGATVRPVPQVALRAVAEGGVGTDNAGVFVGLDITLVRLTFENSVTTDMTLAVCADRRSPYATLVGTGELAVEPFGGSFYAEARLDLGFYSESYRETFFRWAPIRVNPIRLYDFGGEINP